MAQSSAGNDPSLVGGGSLTALNGVTAIWRPKAKGGDLPSGRFNFTLSGTFVGTVAVERSFDNGTTWVRVATDALGTANSYTAPVSLSIDEPEGYVGYRAKMIAWTSGTAVVRFSQ